MEHFRLLQKPILVVIHVIFLYQKVHHMRKCLLLAFWLFLEIFGPKVNLFSFGGRLELLHNVVVIVSALYLIGLLQVCHVILKRDKTLCRAKISLIWLQYWNLPEFWMICVALSLIFINYAIWAKETGMKALFYKL